MPVSVQILLKFFGKMGQPKVSCCVKFLDKFKISACIDISSSFPLPLLKVRVGTYMEKNILIQIGLLLNYF